MNTHILIKISDLEKKIEHYKFKLKACDGTGIKTHDYYRMQGFLTIYEDMLDINKQVSLNPKDFEILARANAPVDSHDNPAYPNHSDTDIFITGYTQALKDLI